MPVLTRSMTRKIAEAEAAAAAGASSDSSSGGTSSKSQTRGPHTKKTKAREGRVRRQLKETKIESTAQDNASTTAPAAAESEGHSRGRPGRKRSFKEDDQEDAEPNNVRRHVRKRSREFETDDGRHSDDGKTTQDQETAMCDPEPEPALTATSEDQEIPDQPSTPPAEQDQDASGVGETSTNHKDPQTQQDPATVQASTIESTSPSLPVEDAVAEKALEAAPEQDATKPIEQTPEAPDQKNMSTENIPPGSGFANASSNSPFSTIADPKSPSKVSGAFASSGFASFSTTTQSPFGSLSPSKPMSSTPAANGFATPPATTQSEKLSFASGSPKTFGPTSGFGSLGGSFGTSTGLGSSGFGSGSTLKSFASSATGPKVTGLSTKPVKAFGASADDEREEGGDGDDGDDDPEASATGSTDDVKDERFHEQEVETGEKGEATPAFANNAKLYFNIDKVWKDRGKGTFKFNVKRPTPDGEEAPQGDGNVVATKPTARFIMRAERTQRTLLNSPITTDVLLEDRHGGPPKSQVMKFLGFVDGKPTSCMLRVTNMKDVHDLYEQFTEFKASMDE